MTEAWEPVLEPREGRPDKGGFPVGLTIATAIAMAILIGLGVWQLQRLQWKENLLAHVAALQAARPQPIGPVLDALARGRDVDLTRVTVVCPGLAAAPFLEMYDLRNGEAGVRLISACPVETARYENVLVDRGYVADSTKARPAVDPASRTPVTVTGVLRKPDRGNFATPRSGVGHWYLREARAMGRALDARQPAPMFLFAETSTNPELKALVPAPLPVEIPNNHLGYALTWFGLAGALAFVYAATLFRRVRT
jgi:surfeit locus 1 family protein